MQATGTDEPGNDPVRSWLAAGEYEKLPTVERNQMALDRWKAQTRRSNWEIGRDYERFIGWTYESLGYAVEYTGAIEGFRNMGRDLICRRGSDFRVVQCKYWRQEKEIHEKHIFQLFGSAMEYAFKSGHPLESVKPVLHTSTKLSDVAKKAAEVLHVEFHESVALGDYPLIKCNIRNKQKIYHLPFDQLYDRAHITQAGEQYCYTVKEAEELGFRRAWKWRGQQDAA